MFLIISRKELHKFMAKQKENAVVHSQEQLADGIYSMWINTEAAKDAKPGQFISMYTTDEASCFHVRSVSVRLIKRTEDFVLFTV